MKNPVKVTFRTDRTIYEDLRIRCIRENKTIQAKMLEIIGKELEKEGPLRRKG